MNQQTPWTTVNIKRDKAGLLVVEPAGASAPGRVQGGAISFAGGHVVVDITSPALPPRAVIDDHHWAQVWLGSIYGAEVAAAIHAVAADGVTRSVEASRGPLTDTVVRLGTGYWIHRWWPGPKPERIAPIDVNLLEIELGALAWTAEECFIDHTPIQSLLEPHLGYLADLVEAARTPDLVAAGVNDASMIAVLLLALRAAVDVVSATTADYDRCADLLDEVEAEQARDAKADAAALQEADLWAMLVDSWGPVLDVLQPRALVGARKGLAHEELDSVALDQGSATVDWIQVPPRVVQPDEDNITWWLLPGRELVVMVSAVLGAELVEPLYGRVLVGGVPWLFELEPDGGTLRGSFEFDEDPDTGALHPDVCATGYMRRSRTSVAGRQAAEQDRRAIRTTVAAQLDGARRVLVGETTTEDFAPFQAVVVAALVAAQ